MSAPDVSVVVVSYNTAGLLEKCLASLPSAAAPLALQAIVVDNGSRDGSPAMVRARFPWVECVDNPGNPGFAHATNRGLERARGRVWVWLNSDCECPAGSLAALAAYLDAHPGVGAVGPRLVHADGRQQPSAQAFPGASRMLVHFLGLRALANWGPLRGLWRSLAPHLGRMGRSYLQAHDPQAPERSVDWISGACLAASADAARAAGALDESYFMYCEDTDWCRRLHASGWDIRWLPQVTVVHHVGGSGARSARVTYHYYRSHLRYFARHQPHAAGWLRVVMLGGCLARGAWAELSRLFGGPEHPWWQLLALSWRGPAAWAAAV